jgi:hypothetical protein
MTFCLDASAFSTQLSALSTEPIASTMAMTFSLAPPWSEPIAAEMLE